MGNFYSRYRVLRVANTFSVAFDPSPAGGDQTDQYSPRFSVLSMFATDDLESCNSSSAILGNFTRPYIWEHRNSVSKTLPNAHIATAKLRHKFSPQRLIRDRTVITTDDYAGTCTRSPTGATPTYSNPNRVVYSGFSVAPYGFTRTAPTPRINGFIAGVPVLSGYITTQLTTKFYSPHDNGDFYGPV